MVNVILSFDDGRRDNFNAFKEILEPLQIPATFNITAGYVNGNIDFCDKPGPHEPMTLEELQEMNRSEYVEIAGHGYTHNNSIESLIDGANWLMKICQVNELGIASPHSEYDISRLNKEQKLLKASGIKYLRISNNYIKLGTIKRGIRKINKFIHNGFLYYLVNSDSVMKTGSFVLYSVPVLKTNTLNEVKKFVEIMSKRNEDESVIFMFLLASG